MIIGMGRFKGTETGTYCELFPRAGLPTSTSWQDLKDLMREAGEVGYTDIKRGTGTAIVQFHRLDDMKYAIKKFDDFQVPWVCDFKVKKTPSPRLIKVLSNNLFIFCRVTSRLFVFVRRTRPSLLDALGVVHAVVQEALDASGGVLQVQAEAAVGAQFVEEPIRLHRVGLSLRAIDEVI